MNGLVDAEMVNISVIKLVFIVLLMPLLFLVNQQDRLSSLIIFMFPYNIREALRVHIEKKYENGG
ncbi:hypothetical protein COU00_03945 [Candidatus Falkowbacteria bacterium CG10_big_fil_rev_8_21_14_0_10_43_11]|uniref:Uncharacterized protein n=1 Tax=Candidatus Falkowbacteria bacterium CG10_big_fil_rev_8_21_14_0_10_43_11 TaxID=1974568 RepID=A0A2M6WL54_9BACT|nr:MAG: hypothetical protein COU00_03945 [Candidatus Falkowbacteria bacterium CG10_big_fil_rev_8_21_14_0_10_43_11]